MAERYVNACFELGPQQRPRDFEWGDNKNRSSRLVKLGAATLAASIGVLLIGQANAGSPNGNFRSLQVVKTEKVHRVAKKVKVVMPEIVSDVNATDHIRDCIAAIEVRGEARPYVAVNGGTPLDEPGSDKTTASGRYQFIDSTWVAMRDRAERHYGQEITDTNHAAFALPVIQDRVAAYTIMHENSQWRWSRCNSMIQNLKNNLKSKF